MELKPKINYFLTVSQIIDVAKIAFAKQAL